MGDFMKYLLATLLFLHGCGLKGSLEMDIDGDGKSDIEVNFDKEAIKQDQLRDEQRR